MSPPWPDYEDLPPVEGMPHGCAWGVFDKGGKKDVFGCLNKITADIVHSAGSEIKTGINISMNWRMGAIKKPNANRKALRHKVISFLDTPMNFHGFDDEVEFNTQCSSQWDGLCHYLHQDTHRGYNGAQPVVQDLVQDFGKEDNDHLWPTLNHWHDRGGLVGRGVLVDYKAYVDAKAIPFSPFDPYAITVQDIEAVLRSQGTSIKEGDIFILRTGYTEVLGQSTPEEQARLMGLGTSAGIMPTEDLARWFWNQHISAVASDNYAFEARLGDGKRAILHQYFLSLFGLHIGELWDLRALSEQCAQAKRYTFFMTSSPLNIPGSVGSPPNALAIF